MRVVDYAWLAPVLCAGAFFFNVLISRQLGRLKHALSATVSLAAIVGGLSLFLVVSQDANAHLEGRRPAPYSEAPGGEARARPALGEDPPATSCSRPCPGLPSGAGTSSPPCSVDWLAIMMLGVVTFLASLIQIYSVGYMRGDNRYWWFFSVMSLFCARC